VRIEIGSRIGLIDIPSEMRSWFIQHLTFPNPKYDDALNRGRYLGNLEKFIYMFETLPNGIVIPRGWLQIVEGSLINKGYGIEIIDRRVLMDPTNVDSNITLRPYQGPAKQRLLENPNGLLVAPAGSGKTVLGLEVFATLRQKMLWLTHTKRLAAQVRDRILGDDENPPLLSNVEEDDIGLIGSGKFKIGNKITVALVQTLVRRLDMLPEIGREFGLVIVDECHHVPATTFIKVIQHFYAYYLYGLTATPYRRDKMENLMFATLGHPTAEIKRSDVRKARGIMTPSFIVRKPPSVVHEGNDYQEIIKDLVLPNELRSTMIAMDVIAEAKEGNYCIVICTRKVYCEALLKKISQGWKKTGIATGDYSGKQNAEQVKRLEDDEITVLITTFELLGEGFDVKKLNRGFIALPFRERARVEQAVGRIQRTCSGKEDAILYDYVDENIGVLNNQFLNRSRVYSMLGMKILRKEDTL